MDTFKKIFKNSKLNCLHASIHGQGEEHDFSGMNESTDEMRELHENLKNHYNFKGNLTHKGNIHEYTKNSQQINGYLWNRHKKSMKQDNSFEREEIHPLDKALSVHKTPHELIVHSSTAHDPEKLKNSEGIVHHPAFLSASTDPTVAHARDINSLNLPNGDVVHHILKIKVPEGHAGAYAAHISQYPAEKEFMLPRGLNLKHIKTTVKKRKFFNHETDKDATHHLKTHEMEIVP